MAENRHTVYFDLQDTLGQAGCALCTLALRSMRRYFGALGYESVNDPGIRGPCACRVGSARSIGACGVNYGTRSASRSSIAIS